jgi:hypothetical protein
MIETELSPSWWESCSYTEFLLIFTLYPKMVLSQIMAACDMAQAPSELNQEIFPTLKPKDAFKLIRQQRKMKYE